MQLQGEDRAAERLFPRCLGLYGSWLAETHSENPHTIVDQFLQQVPCVDHSRPLETTRPVRVSVF